MIWGPCSRAAVYLPSLRNAVEYVRKFASSSSSIITESFVGVDTNQHSAECELVWPERLLGPLGERDPRYPLPGLIGIPTTRPHTPTPVNPDLLFERLPSERYCSVLEQAELHVVEDTVTKEEGFLSEPNPDTMLECVAHNCPDLLRKDFQDLFPNRSIVDGILTVVTLSLHTDNDMSGWSIEVEAERDALILSFVKGAEDICTSLNSSGFWADFIDPISGRPFYGVYTNATLFETDERYRKLGFEITDLGCCKVIRHHVWGTRAFVGCLFTDAPLHHDIVQQLRHKSKAG